MLSKSLKNIQLTFRNQALAKSGHNIVRVTAAIRKPVHRMVVMVTIIEPVRLDDVIEVIARVVVVVEDVVHEASVDEYVVVRYIVSRRFTRGGFLV